MSNLSTVTDNMLPVSSETFVDNLAAGIGAGADIVPMLSLAEYNDGDSVVLTVDPGTSDQATFIGKVDGNDVIDVEWTEGNVGASHAAGATVIDYDSSTHYNVVTKLLRMFANQNGSLKTSAVQAALNISSAVPSDYTTLATPPSSVTYLGDRNFEVVFANQNYTDRLSPGMKVRTERTIAAPTQSALLNGTNQYFVKAAPTGMVFTDDFVVSAWVRISSLGSNNTIASRYNGTSGWTLRISAVGNVELLAYNASSGNYSRVSGYGSVPLNRWVHITAQLDMSAFSASPTTSYVMIDGQSVPAGVDRAGTNPTAFIQAGNFEIGSRNSGTELFPGNIAQVCVFNTKVTQDNMRTYMSQGMTGAEPAVVGLWTLNNSLNDLTANANNLTANNGAIATADASPFGNQVDGKIADKIDYGFIRKASYSAPDTTIIVRASEGSMLPTSGGLNLSYSRYASPYGYPYTFEKRLAQCVFRGNATSTGTNVTPTAVAGMQITFTLYQPSKVKLQLSGLSFYNNVNSAYVVANIYQGSVAAANIVAGQNMSFQSLNQEEPLIFSGEVDLAPGTYTFMLGAGSTGGGTTTFSGATTRPIILSADIVE